MDPKQDFYKNVFEVVALIPFGRVTSYGAIANYLSAKRSSRLVGWAMNASHRRLPKIPAHRVVNRIGLLSGKMHFSSPTEMESLLISEGHTIENNQLVNFDRVFWDPNVELSID